MAKQGMLAGNSYEVLTKNGTRWTIDAAFKKKYDALTRAGELLSTNEYECVRVLEERKGDDEEYIIFEETAQLKQKPIKIVPVKEAPVCQNFPDYYKYSARKTIGRLIRGYLDQHGMIALQLYYDTGYLAYLERMDTYYNGAIRHVGSLQAKILDEKPNDRADAIYKAFARIREQARDRDDVIPYNKILAEEGFDKALQAISTDIQGEMQGFYIYGMIAAYLGKGSWANMLSMMMDLAETAKDEASLACIDEVMAEILDGNQSLQDVFGALPSPVRAWRAFAQTVSGNYKAPKYSTEEVQRLNWMFSTYDLPLTQAVLLERVSKGLKGTKPISREGRDADREKFISLIYDIIEPTGIVGGSVMSEAVILRTKTLLSDGDEDLPIESAIRKLIYLLPSNAARLGFLLDLTGTDVGKKYGKPIRVQLGILLAKLHTVTDLFPRKTDDTTRQEYLDALKKRVGMSALPDELKDSFEASLQKIASIKKSDMKP
ncbi:MAG: hypothetical protein HN416_16705, partial [Nitrospina sp.]|nr:hypothetical protein [Nitrospina sp.]